MFVITVDFVICNCMNIKFKVNLNNFNEQFLKTVDIMLGKYLKK